MSNIKIQKSISHAISYTLHLTLYTFPTISILEVTGIPERYHTYDEVVSELDSIAQAYPNITRLDSIGISTTDSLTIWAMKISDNPLVEEDEPSLLYNGIHHAEELLGAEICMYMINDLVNRYGVDSVVTNWVNNLEIWIVPIINPDGHNIVTSCIDTIWRKNIRDNNNNGFFDADSDGVDLNRNYDFNWSAGNSDPTSEYYRGTVPFSELETQAIRNLTIAQHFVFDVCYHSARTGTKEVIYYPWRWGTNFSPDYPTIKPIADSMAKLIINEVGNGTYATIWGTVEEGGSARSWFYGAIGTISFTVEVCTCCIPPGDRVDDVCQRNLQGAYFLLDRVMGSSIAGHITDYAGAPLEAEVKILEAYSSILPPRLSESQFGRYRRILAPGVYTVEVSKHGYNTVTMTNVVVDTGVPTTLDIQLPYVGVEENSKLKTQNPNLEIYPNPFRDKVIVHFSCSSNIGDTEGEHASLKTYDLSGRLVNSILNVEKISGCYEAILDVKDLGMGVYFVKFVLGDYKKTRKIIFIK